jgi:hypothetical protein
MIGLSHELFANFNISLNWRYKDKSHIICRNLYSIDTDEFWYHPDQTAAKRWWVPFTTIVPGTGDYPDETINMYARSADSPAPYTQYTIGEDRYHRYQALEVLFNKRMSNGWQLSGNIVWSKTYGTSFGAVGGGGVSDLNQWVNGEGRIGHDRPLAIKVMGSVQLPLNFTLSSYYRYMSGLPWTRTASIRPPRDWCVANNAVYQYYSVNLEPAGSRRFRAINYLDVRLERSFMIGDVGRLAIQLDVFNLLGFTSLWVDENDVYRYTPSAENVLEPQNVTLRSAYRRVSDIEGLRTMKLSFRFTF